MRKISVVCLEIIIILLLSTCGTHRSSSTSTITPTAVIHAEPADPPVQSAPSATPKIEKIEANCRLVVNGKDIISENCIVLTQESADLLFIAIMKVLGAEVAWKNNTTAVITFRR